MIGQNSNGEEVCGRSVLRYSNSFKWRENGLVVREGGELACNIWSEVEDQLSVFCLVNNRQPQMPTIGPQVPKISPVDTPSPTVSLGIVVSHLISFYVLNIHWPTPFPNEFPTEPIGTPTTPHPTTMSPTIGDGFITLDSTDTCAYLHVHATSIF